MRRLVAFVKRDWLIYSSYRMSLLLRVAGVFFLIAPFFFVGMLIDPTASPVLAPYGGAYFPFLLLGLAFSRYLSTSLSGFSADLREDQLQGTLDAIVATPTPMATMVAGGVLWEFLWTSAEVALFLGFGVIVFGLDLGQMDVVASLVLLALTVVSLSSLGVLSASGILLFKESEPISVGLGGLMKLFGGVYFPVALLPGGFQVVAGLFPLTYALEGLRQAVLMGRPLGELWGVCGALLAFALVLWPIALVSFSWTLRRLKQTGTLSFR